MAEPIRPIEPDEIPASRIMRERAEFAQQAKLLAAENDLKAARILGQRKLISRYREFLRDVWEVIHCDTKPSLDSIETLLHDALETEGVGDRCEVCDGDGMASYEADTFHSNAGHGSSYRLDECGNCINGRVPFGWEPVE